MECLGEFACKCGCAAGCRCGRCKPRVIGRWHQLVQAGPKSPVHTIGIERSSDGSYLAFSGRVDDTYNANTRSERFTSFNDALAFIGWPVGLVDLPADLAKLA